MESQAARGRRSVLVLGRRTNTMIIKEFEQLPHDLSATLVEMQSNRACLGLSHRAMLEQAASTCSPRRDSNLCKQRAPPWS